MKHNLILSVTALLIWVNSSFPQSKIIRAGKMFDSRTGQILQNQKILIEYDKITEVAPDNGKYPADATIIDLTKNFVMPGLVDAHVHVFLHPYNETSWDDQVLKESIPLRTLRAGNHAYEALLAGFTAVRDLGTEGAEYADLGVKQAIEQGIIDGARLYISSKAIVISGAYGPKEYASHINIPKGAEEADGVEEVRKAVRKQLANGADWIKLYADYRRDGDETYVMFTEDEIRVAVEEAAAMGRFVSCHATIPEAIKRSVKAGAKSIEHGTYADEASLQLMKEKGAALVPTLTANESMLEYSFTDADKFKYQQRVEAQKKAFQTALKVGVNIVCGSDAGVFKHGDNAFEIEFLVDYGMTPVAALQAATLKAAYLIDPKVKFGVIEEGALADIIAIDGDPVANIADLNKVIFVMKEGDIYIFPDK